MQEHRADRGSNPATFATVAGIMISAAAVAVMLPARRAVRVDQRRHCAKSEISFGGGAIDVAAARTYVRLRGLDGPNFEFGCLSAKGREP